MANKHHDYDAMPTGVNAPTWLQELRVVMVVLAFVLALELIARIIAPVLDFDRENIYAFPEVIKNLEEKADESGNPEVVFFGNSLMLHGLDQELVKQELEKADGPEIETAKVTPVGTAMLDWVYLYRRYFSDENSHPDVLVVGFVSHHIHDQEPIKLRRLSRHFVAKEDLPLLWKTDLKDFHRTTQSVLCNISALEGDQPEHQLGILQTLIADYKAGLNRNNRLVADGKKRKAELASKKNPVPRKSTEPEETYERMKRFIAEARQHGVKIYFIPMPQPEVWDFNPEAQKIIEAEGMTVLDARAIPGMTPEDFSDGYHLGETGKVKFSRWMAGQLKAQLEN
ncbi:hypothetical protein JO972_01970 [Verrucomicrobiaceae bacterium 5K15]|uniref:Uncharacterized protein n=1 Tax=Oceaniferula flava TaxID=2800421 RepID=A0AAE2SB26_9BACT|nr:hypothetical protein [Oceaniferula flavus]MBK1853712.1 hypothetical protein [Oceaniferula flavus]MBM1135018.1 hypothetical protein [Oceaniferula flavus]